MNPIERASAEQLLHLALLEDFGDLGDITSLAVIPATVQGKAAFVARKPGRLAGMPLIGLTCAAVSTDLHFEPFATDGAILTPGMVLGEIHGPMRAILAAERTALNFLQRLSGIASLTHFYVEAVRGTKAVVLDTRKTTPGWRRLEKYAVRMGGGVNHRIGLFDGMLIKDNHIAAVGTGPEAVAEAVRRARQAYPHVPIEIEVDTLEQLDAALVEAPDIVLLDNMPPDLLRIAVGKRDAQSPRTLLEASGGINRDTVRAIAETGIERISIGALTHSATALDIGLDYLEDSTESWDG